MSGQPQFTHLEQANQNIVSTLPLQGRTASQKHTAFPEGTTKFEVAVFFENEQFVDHLRGVRCEVVG